MKHSIFAIEVCARIEPGSALPGWFRRLVLSHPEAATYRDKWRLYRSACDALLQNLSTLERGCWDYFDDDARALRDYKMWCDGMTTEEGARAAPSSGESDPYRSGGEARYMTFTMAFLLAQGSATDQQLAARCAIPEGSLWNRDVFERLLQGIPMLNFASVKSDVVYVIPGDERWALTAQDLAHQKFEYLRQIV